jgi:hypothetical protein
LFAGSDLLPIAMLVFFLLNYFYICRFELTLPIVPYLFREFIVVYYLRLPSLKVLVGCLLRIYSDCFSASTRGANSIEVLLLGVVGELGFSVAV